MNENSPLVLLFVGFISLVMLFAQLKLFSIDATLKEVLRALRDQKREPQQVIQSVSDTGETAPAQEKEQQVQSAAELVAAGLALACPFCGKSKPKKASRCGACWRRIPAG